MTKKKTPAARAIRHKTAIRSRRTPTRRLLMHPTVTFGLLVLGVFLAGLTFRVAADSYTINAVVEASPLQSGAIITSPGNNAVFSKRPIMIGGTCPDDGYVILTRNGGFSGVAICNNGTFQIETDLYVGVNDLLAQAYGITDQPGPVTPGIRVMYNPPSGLNAGTPKSTVKSTAPDGVVNKPLLLTSDYHFNVSTTHDTFTWSLQFHSEAEPYTAHVEWGDGKTSEVKVSSDDAFTIRHRYTARGYYTIRITGHDTYGRESMIQLIAFIKEPGDPATSGSILKTPASPQAPSKSGGYSWVIYVWPVYLIVILMIVSFWLGERREYLHLLRQPLGHKRLRHT